MIQLTRKQYSPEGKEEIDFIAMQNWEEARGFILHLFNTLAHAAQYDETQLANGANVVSVKDRDGRIIHQLKTKI